MSLTTFNFNGADVRTIVLPNGEPGFVGKDVAERLGYANPSDAIGRHCKGVVIRYPLPTAGGLQETRVLTEPDVLRLIVSSNLPAAQEFERWVFSIAPAPGLRHNDEAPQVLAHRGAPNHQLKKGSAMADKNSTALHAVGVRTMSTREIADLTGKRHDNVMADAKAMLEELGLNAPDFSGSFQTAQGNTYECLNLPKRESLILVSGYSVSMRARIIDRWEALESGKAQPLAMQAGGAVEAMAVAEALANMLRLDGSARLDVARKALEITAPHLLAMAPVYAIDAPAGAPAVSSEPTESLTALMARFRVGVSTRAGNLILQGRGLLEKRTRPSSGGTTKSFWSVTEKGRAFGKNVSSPENPRETQPHWFSRKGEELLRVMGVQE